MNGRAKQIWFHALGAKTGGGITYLRHVVPELGRQIADRNIHISLLIPTEWTWGPLPRGITPRVMPRESSSFLKRLAYDQWTLPRELKSHQVDALYCSGSFAPIRGGCRTVVLVRNAIYFDRAFLRQETLRRRTLWRLMRRLIVAGARRASCVMYPTRACRELAEATCPMLAGKGCTNSYGIGDEFIACAKASPPVHAACERPRFLYVMNYLLQKNLTTILLALAEAKRRGLPVTVQLTSQLEDGPPASKARDAALIQQHDLIGSGYLEPLGPQFGEQLRAAYRSADACLFLSTCESFGHPLVEALGMGKPLLCADLPYAREICGEHAHYVPPYDPLALVTAWQQWGSIAATIPPVPPGHIAERFSWSLHVRQLLAQLIPEAPPMAGANLPASELAATP